ncbi:MAG TPA: adenosylcobinamide-phosphate synthase CbiB [Rectinemataceae bacterium]|nr:adenosylcobinamide-phosphate synthase CbiB [Rectinemataceae bacterium]
MNIFHGPALLLPSALLLDALLGDPRRIPHPVRAMGRSAALLDPATRRLAPPLVAGALGWIAIVGGSVAAALALVQLASLAGGALTALVGLSADGGTSAGRWAASVYLVYVSIAPRDLAAHALRVVAALRVDGLPAGRKAVSMIVGRDVENLDEAALLRATVESVAESTVDGVCAPLFWALVLGPAGAIAYRAANTLDSLWGHRDERRILFGRVAARADDLLSWIPARLSFGACLLAAALLAPLSRGKIDAGAAANLGWRDRRKHESPNAAWLEAAFAGALGLALGGPAWYGGELIDKPVLGEARRPIERADVKRAVFLMYATTLVFVALGLLAHEGMRIL